MQDDTVALEAPAACPDHLCDAFIEWVRKGDMTDDSAFEECKWPNAFGPVDDLVWDDEIARLDRFLQAANCRECNDGAHPYASKSCDVGSGIDLVRGELMVDAMAAQKSNWYWLA